MKEDTKKKFCKISKIVGFAITFGFAVFGVLCAAMLIANGSGKKDDIKTLDSSLVQNEVRSERNIKPRKVPFIPEEAANLFDGALVIEDIRAEVSGFTYINWCNVLALEVEEGYYYLKNDLSEAGYYLIGVSATPEQTATYVRGAMPHNPVNGDTFTIPESYDAVSYASSRNSEGTYFYFPSCTILLSIYEGANPYLALVDSLDIPSEEILELPDNWSPLRMVAKNVNKENNLIFGTDWNYWTDVPQANGQPMLDLSTILFRNQGRIYNHIYIYFKNLNGLKYATNSENIGTGNSTDWCADRLEYAFVVGNSLKYNYLASSVGTSILQGETVFNLGLNWSNPSARKLEILDKRYPNNFAIGDTLLGRFPRNGTNSLDPVTGQTIRPFGYGVWDYDYLLEYSNVSSIDFVLGGSSDVFGLLTGAFNGLLPILSVQILPNITLGILLFLPLIGGIIVIIIRVIKK